MNEYEWVVNLGDGTWVALDSRPTVMLVKRSSLDEWDDAPDCQNNDNPDIFTHIHIKDLVENSHWNDDANPTHHPVT